MGKIYLVWDTEDYVGVPDDEGDEASKRARRVCIRHDLAAARALADETYAKVRLSQLVVEVAKGGELKNVYFVGSVGANLMDDYGAWYRFCRQQSELALAAAVVVLALKMAAEEV